MKRLTLRLDEALVQELHKRAKEQRRSLQKSLEVSLEAAVLQGKAEKMRKQK
jgi:hypothetical protein